MNLGNILKKVGSTIIRDLVPGGGLIIDLVNGFLPKDKALPITATGTEIQTAVDALPPEKRMELMSKELDVEIAEAQEWTKTMSVLADVDKVGASTRPKIALMMAWVVIYAEIIAVSAWGWAVVINETMSLESSWPLIVAILATPVALLRAYFAMRSRDKRSRYELAGAPKSMGVIENIISAFKGR